MTILKVYDTVLEAQRNAMNERRNYIVRGFDIKYLSPNINRQPYKIEIGDDCYIYAINNPRYLRGIRFDKIEDYTRSGICDEIRVCEL